ncbi:TonB-dependent receptor plug domain-containing protein [Chitinophaga pinensis]|uniref:TonB-dependent receptor plug n=1 Tax=Chitinophaga pinensis (strain ATCC 43595 / DSM 2588 / LMG 13176 / NBRC 15968 / NCIMB 11800 / UQM 2034) TaxID=485918 RepID=A0A979G6P6_CHIPD|nr:TonB-dependent receptor [Chitinophaga pinensis]ACU61860.1 TonB-dependent receptor plug [Chitinophaga pinensis DSM 2588]
MFSKLTLPVAASLLCTLTLKAQEKISDLDAVTVTATVNPVVSSKTGRNLYVIKGEDIARMPVHSVDEVLRYLPGVEVQAKGPMGAGSDIVIRGGTFQQVLVILDGIRVNDPNTGHFSSYIPVNPAEIDHIEVLKGASSAIYGSDAVGGVIHIITKTFARTGTSTPTRKITAGVTGGEYGLFNANANAYYSTEKLAVNIGGQTNNADGQPQRGIDGYFHLHTVSGSASYRFNENWKLSYRLSYDSRKFAAQNFYTTFASDTASEKLSTWWQQLNLQYRKGKDGFSLMAGYKNMNDHYVYNSVSLANDNRSKLFQSLAIYEHAFSNDLNLVAGGQFQQKNIVSNDRGNHTVNQAAGFVSLTATLFDALTLSPAVRLDWDERSGSELVPQLNASYRTGKFQVRGSAGKTIRNADFTERYNNNNKPIVTSGKIGNPDLKAERSFSYEAGADYFGKTLRVSSTVFQRRYNDLIDWATTPYANMPYKHNLSPTGTYSLATNISKMVTSGLETDIQWTKTYKEKHTVSATAGTTWLYSDIQEGQSSFYISSHARFLLNGMLQYRNSLFSISANGLYKVRDPQSAANIAGVVTKEYFIASVKADVFVIKNMLSLSVEADNVFNKTYADLTGAQMPGRWLMGGVRLTL